MQTVYALWHRLPIVGKLLLTTGFALLLAGGMLLQTTVWRDAENIRRELASELASDVSMLPSLLAEPLVMGDYAALSQILERYARRENIAALRYRSASGKNVDARNPYVEPQTPILFAVWLAVDDVRSKVRLVTGNPSTFCSFFFLTRSE